MQIGLLAALAPAMAIRQLMSDVRPDEEAALRALVPPVEPIQQPQDNPVLGFWPMQQLINPGAPLVTWSPGESAVVRAVVDGPGPMRPSRTRSRTERACTHWKCTFCKAEWLPALLPAAAYVFARSCLR